MADYEETNADPIRYMFDYDPILDNFHDKMAGTTTVYKEEVLRNPMTNQPITNSEGKPITYLKQTRIPKSGVEPLMDTEAIDFAMGALQGVVNKASAFAMMTQGDIVYEACSTVAALNDAITLNSQKYHITNMGAWFSQTKLIRNFVYKYGLAVKGGNLKDWSTGVMGVKYQMDLPKPQQQEGFLQRAFHRRGMVDNNQNFQ